MIIITLHITFFSNHEFLLYCSWGNAGSCYYEHYESPFIHYNDYSVYEFCLTGCCGSTKIDGRKHCCKDAGAIIGIFLGAAGFLAFLLIICALCRRRHQSDAFVINGSMNEAGLFHQLQQPRSNHSATDHKHYESQGRYNYQQTNTTTGYIYTNRNAGLILTSN
ncbi:unnamed protein product [Mytilus edulis]|uniref:Uncharacterized protein n=1 Tax=Mytilus edulis TaxID=6550 RepID=A0A8S3S4Q8_MYTED|nr:unnamed protein product [Mytilus edulis]